MPGFAGLVDLHDAPVAFAAGDCEQWQDRTIFYLKEMCVRADLRGQGIGTRLLDRLHADPRANRGVSSTYLLTMGGDRTETFYSKNGCRTHERMIVVSHCLEPPVGTG